MVVRKNERKKKMLNRLRISHCLCGLDLFSQFAKVSDSEIILRFSTKLEQASRQCEFESPKEKITIDKAPIDTND